jgi:predicted acylesterase/phospholipase RssA
MAHLGAVRAIREAGIPIDRVGGTSGGAMFAAQVAMGWDHQTMMDVTREQMVTRGSLLDFSVPIISVIKGNRWRRALREMFGTRRIETLRIPFFCVSTNLSRGELAIHREGLLWRWVRASLSVPGLAPPLVENGELYVDGSVLNNLPIDVMRDLAPGPIIALTVGSEQGPQVGDVQDRVPSKWAALRARLTGGDATPDVPSIVDILMGATMVSGRRTSKAFEPMANLVIHPEVSEFGLLEFSALDRLVEIGYRNAVEALQDWSLP